MGNPLQDLKDRVLSKRGQSKETELTNILDMVRGFSCLGEIIGRDFEIRNSEGELVYTIHQKPIAIKQMNVLLKEFATLKMIDNENEAKKWGSKNSNKSGRRMK